MKIEEMVAKGLIRKEEIKSEEISGSLGLARRFLERAKGNLNISFWDVAFILAYSSMFHAARALLFKNGYKERSHFALIQVLKEKYKGNYQFQRFLETLDSYRISRHAIQYRGDICSKVDADEAVKDAEGFLKLAEKILKE